jgi:hypothetical protein
MKSQLVRRFLVASLVFAFVTDAAKAQILYGSVVGFVRDASDAAVAGAKVHITNTQTNESREAETGVDGSFTLPAVQSGTYEIRVSREGFQTYIRKDVNVSINSTVRVNVSLQVGAVNESVSVSAQAASLQTDRTEVRGEITDKTLVEVPVPGHYATDLGTLGAIKSVACVDVRRQWRNALQRKRPHRRGVQHEYLAAAYFRLRSGAGID